MPLQDHVIPATAPRDDSAPTLVIFFHGYGSSGAWMAQDMQQMLAEKLPEAKVIFPDAPDIAWQDDKGNKGYSWFQVDDMLEAPDGAVSAARATAAAPAINKWIDGVMAREGVDESRVVIAGFSQGATMAYVAALLRDKPVAGVFALSGGGLDQIGTPISKPPVGLAAGQHEQQEYSGVPHALKTQVFLDKQGFRTDCVILPDQGHDVTPAAVDLLAALTRQLVPAAPKVSAPAPETVVPRKPTGPSSPRI